MWRSDACFCFATSAKGWFFDPRKPQGFMGLTGEKDVTVAWLGSFELFDRRWILFFKIKEMVVMFCIESTCSSVLLYSGSRSGDRLEGEVFTSKTFSYHFLKTIFPRSLQRLCYQACHLFCVSLHPLWPLWLQKK